MTKNDPFARVFRDSPRFEAPPASNVRSGAARGGDAFAQVFPDTPMFEAPPASNAGSGAVRADDPFAQVFPDIPRAELPHDLIFDSDGDGFIDPWDCQPFNPEEDGFWGNVWRSVTSRVKRATSRARSSYSGRSSSRRSSSRRSSSWGSSARKYVRRVVPRRAVVRRAVTRQVRAAVARAPIHVSRERAADRRASVTRAVSAAAAPVTAAVRAAVARAPVHVSRERAAERRASVASAFGVDFGRAADRRASVTRAVSAAAAPVTAAVRTAVARAPIHVSRERAADRRASVTRAVSAVAAPATAAVRAAVAKAPIHVSRERAAERRADLASTLGVDFERAADRRAAAARVVTAGSLYLSPIGVAAAAPGDPDKGDVRERMIAAGVLPDTPPTLTTGVDGEPGQPDRAGDVHAYVGIPKTPPGSRGEDALGAGESASDADAGGFWGQLSAWARPVTQPLGLYGAPVEKRAMQTELGEYQAAHAKAEAMAADYDATYAGQGPVTPEQAVAADASRLAILDQQAVATREYGEYIGAVGAHEGATESWFGKADKSVSKHIPTLYDISDAGESFRAEHKGKIDVVRAGYEKYSPQVARDIIYPFAGGVAVGAYDAAQKHPVSVAATAAAFVAAPYALVGVARGATALGATRVGTMAVGTASKIPGVRATARIAGPAALRYGPKALLAVWAGSAGYRVAKAETPGEKGQVLGEMLVREAVPFAVAAGAPAVLKHLPKVVRTSEYTGLVTRGHVKPVYKTVEVPKINRGGVLEADLLRSPPTVLKTVVSGQVMTSPKPLLGVRTGKFTTPEGVTTTYKGLQIGKGWTPAELTKTIKMESVTGAEGTALAMEKLTQARLGQFRYEHAGFARGKIDPGYFLPKGRTPSEGLLRLTTAEKGLVPVRDAPNIRLLTEGVPKPTRVYAEVKQPYMKAVDAPLAGSPAHIRWVEAGFRKVSYGVKGAPGVKGGKQVRVEVEAEPWGYHPTFPPGIAAGEAVVPSYLSPTPSVRQIPTGMYFHPAGAPSSRVLTVESLLRPKTTGIRPLTEPIAAKPTTARPLTEPIAAKPTTARPPIEPIAVKPKPIIEPVRARAPEPAAPVAPGVTFAEPVKSPVLDAILGGVKVAKPTAPAVPARPRTVAEMLAHTRLDLRPTPSPSTPAVPARPRTVAEMLAHTRAPKGAPGPRTGGRTVPFRERKYKPAPEPKRKTAPIPIAVADPIVARKRKTAPIPIAVADPIVARKQETAPIPIAVADPIVAQKPATAVDVIEKQDEYVPIPVPDGGYVPSPPPRYVPPPPPVPIPPPPPVTEGGKYVPPPPVVTDPFFYPPPFGGGSGSGGGAAPRRRRAHEWELKHTIVTLDSFLGGIGKPATGAFPEPDLGLPVAGGRARRPGLLDVPAKKAAGGRARRPGLLDVPPGW